MKHLFVGKREGRKERRKREERRDTNVHGRAFLSVRITGNC